MRGSTTEGLHRAAMMLLVPLILGACAADPPPENAQDVVDLAARCQLEEAMAEADRLTASNSRFVRQAGMQERAVLLLDQGRVTEAAAAQAQIAQESGTALEEVQAQHAAALQELRAQRLEVTGREVC